MGKKKKQASKAKQRLQKHRARYWKILSKWWQREDYTFDGMVAELGSINVKYLQTMLDDLKGGHIHGYSNIKDKLIAAVEFKILEGTILK